jgi:hypothetical protein
VVFSNLLYQPKALRMKITDPEQARVFFDTNITTILSPFLARDCTVARAAEQLKIAPSRMSYWVKKTLRAGLACACWS